MIKGVTYKYNISTLDCISGDSELKMNDISKVKIKTTKLLMTDSYRENRTTGSINLVYDAIDETLAAGIIV